MVADEKGAHLPARTLRSPLPLGWADQLLGKNIPKPRATGLPESQGTAALSPLFPGKPKGASPAGTRPL